MDKKGQVLWFTGLSGAGKSTLAVALQACLNTTYHIPTIILDGDILRRGLCCDLGFSPRDRTENIRRASELARLLSDNGQYVIAALITPTEKDRQLARHIIGEDRFHQIYIKADIATCSKRDPKGLYQKAFSGEIKEFTGISSPFEEPETSELVIETQGKTLEESPLPLVDYALPVLTAPEQIFHLA